MVAAQLLLHTHVHDTACRPRCGPLMAHDAGRAAEAPPWFCSATAAASSCRPIAIATCRVSADLLAHS
eukprot:5108823-Alexandrium_andersonii.AAC.1